PWRRARFALYRFMRSNASGAEAETGLIITRCRRCGPSIAGAVHGACRFCRLHRRQLVATEEIGQEAGPMTRRRNYGSHDGMHGKGTHDRDRPEPPALASCRSRGAAQWRPSDITVLLLTREAEPHPPTHVSGRGCRGLNIEMRCSTCHSRVI